MIERQGTWGEVAEGTTLLSPNELPLVVVRAAPDKRGRLWYLAQDHNKREFRITPKPSQEPVRILESTEEEAEWLATNRLGAHRLLDDERDRRMEERARNWIVPPFPTKGRGALDRARNHVDWYHGAYAGDAQYAGGFKTLKQIAAAHTEMHEVEFMDMPHTHEK